jgi:predicted nicotinamide N-methyase
VPSLPPTRLRSTTSQPDRRAARLRTLVGLAGVMLAASAPGWGATAQAASGPPHPIQLGPVNLPHARDFADIRAAARPGNLALQAAHRPAVRVGPALRLLGATTTYYALQPNGTGAALVRFRTDGRAHVSGRTVLSLGSPDSVVAPTSAVGGVLVATEASPLGQNVVAVDAHGRIRRLTSDGRSSFGLLTPAKRIVFVTSDSNGEAEGLAQVDLNGGGRRTVFREHDPDAVLSLPALSPNGRTAYLVRNVFDRQGLPQSSLLTIDIATGRTATRALPGMNYVVSMAASSTGRELAFVGYRAADNVFAKWIGFRAEADVIGTSSGAARRVAWVQDPVAVFSRGGSRLVVSADDRLVSVGVTTSHRDPLFGTEGLSLPVLAR